MYALSNLTQNPNIVISPADKSGGVVIMHKHRYVDKIHSIFDDTNTYEVSNLITTNRTLSHSTNSKKTRHKQNNLDYLPKISTLYDLPKIPTLYNLPKIPTLYELPKIYKPNNPLRPIISSIDFATHKIAHAIAKILTPLRGIIAP